MSRVEVKIFALAFVASVTREMTTAAISSFKSRIWKVLENSARS